MPTYFYPKPYPKRQLIYTPNPNRDANLFLPQTLAVMPTHFYPKPYSLRCRLASGRRRLGAAAAGRGGRPTRTQRGRDADAGDEAADEDEAADAGTTKRRRGWLRSGGMHSGRTRAAAQRQAHERRARLRDGVGQERR